jgi:putative ABC transport system permease protein
MAEAGEKSTKINPAEVEPMKLLNLIENILQDIRYAIRAIYRSPGITSVAIFSLALGIGANTAVFQLLNAVRLRSLPVANPQELAEVRIAGGNGGYGSQNGINSELSNALWEEIRQSQEAFSGIFAWGNGDFYVGDGGDARRAKGLYVSGDFFSTLGVSPLQGRLFTTDDDRRGCGNPGAVISYEFWRNYLGGANSVIGGPLRIQDRLFTVIGVTPPGFFGLEVGQGFDVALPICAREARALDRIDYFWLVVMGRLKPDWTLAQAAASVNTKSRAIFEATRPPGYDIVNLDRYLNFRLTAVPAGRGVSRLRQDYETLLWSLLAITGLVLLIACANLGNLMLARASSREREMAVRIALGASRGRLIRLLLSESLLLAGIGTALAAGLARWLSHSLTSLLTTEGNLLQLDLSVDWRVLAFTAIIAVLTCVIFSLVPALRASQINPAAAVKSSARGLTANRERFSYQRFLVIGQIAFSLVLLVGALLFARSFWNLMTLDLGYRRSGILFVSHDFSKLHLTADQVIVFQKKLLEQIKSIAQVESATFTTHTPLSGNGISLKVRGLGEGGNQASSSKFTYLSPGYFRTLGIPVLAGRDFNDFDTTTSSKVVIVNETFVRRFIANRRPIGALVRSLQEPKYPETIYEVIGVVKDTKYANLRQEIPPMAFAPMTQNPNPQPGATIAIHSSVPPSGVIAEVRRKVNELSPEIRIEFRVFDRQIREGLIRERLMAWLAGAFGVLAAILAIVGLYGVISYRVLKRQNEIGIRLALGASRQQIVLLILREVVVLLLIGLGIGTAVSLAAARGARSLLFGLSPNDIPTLVASVCLLALVAGGASFVPALRASRVDPIIALRQD